MADFDFDGEIIKRGYSSIKKLQETFMIGKIKEDDTLFVVTFGSLKLLVNADLVANATFITYTSKENRVIKPTTINEDMDFDVIQDGIFTYELSDENKTRISLSPVIVQIDRVGREPNGDLMYRFNMSPKIKVLNRPVN